MNTPIRLAVALFFLANLHGVAQRPIEEMRARQSRPAPENPRPGPKAPEAVEEDQAEQRRSPGARAFREFIERELKAATTPASLSNLKARIIHRVCEIASRTELLPRPEGLPREPKLTPAQRQLHKELKSWLTQNNEGVCSVRPGPFAHPPFEGFCTRKGNTLYLHVFYWPANGLRLSGLRTEPSSANILDTGEQLVVQNLRQLGSSQADTVLIGTPRKTNPLVTVVKLRLKDSPRVSAAMASKSP